MRTSTFRTKIITALSVLILLLLWQLAAVVIDAQVILPTPYTTSAALVNLIRYKPLSKHIFTTISRSLQSFLIIFVTGSLFGVVGAYYKGVDAALQPLLTIFKATPVMAIILLAFIWFTSGTVPLFSAFLMGFPIMYLQIKGGVQQISVPLQEMVKLYQFPKRERLFHLVLPSLLPSFITGAKASLAMVWKVVIAAEVLTVPRFGIGSRMQLAQINLETAEVLSWTLIAILLTVVGDLLFLALLKIPRYLRKERV